MDDDDDKWKLVPYFGAVLVFFSWIVQSGLGAIKRKAARLKPKYGDGIDWKLKQDVDFLKDA